MHCKQILYQQIDEIEIVAESSSCSEHIVFIIQPWEVLLPLCRWGSQGRVVVTLTKVVQ
jgi:hypothetical protein